MQIGKVGMKARIICGLLLVLCASEMKLNAVLVNCQMPIPVERFINFFGEDIQKRHRVELVAMNDRDNLGASVIDLLFDYYGDWDVAKARGLVVGIADAFLVKVASETSLENYFCHYPLTLADVTIKIRHRKTKCGFVYPTMDNVESVLLQDGRIYYETINANTYAINVLRTESYDTAQDILNYNASGNSTLFPSVRTNL